MEREMPLWRRLIVVGMLVLAAVGVFVALGNLPVVSGFVAQ